MEGKPAETAVQKGLMGRRIEEETELPSQPQDSSGLAGQATEFCISRIYGANRYFHDLKKVCNAGILSIIPRADNSTGADGEAVSTTISWAMPNAQESTL